MTPDNTPTGLAQDLLTRAPMSKTGPGSVPAAAPSTATRVSLTTADGHAITAIRHAVPARAGPVRARILVAGATGVPQGFYQRFAAFASTRGFETMTLDYRGVGLSSPKRLRGYQMDYRDWARQDLAAAVKACSGSHNKEASEGVSQEVNKRLGNGAQPSQLQLQLQSLPLYVVGPSYGGHAMGLLPEPERVSGLYTFATGAGWHGWMPPAERWRVALLWRVLGPLVTPLYGYLPGKLAGVGENLPLGVYRQWRKWCSRPRYFFDDPEIGAEMATLFARVRMPMVAANALDDWWALPASRSAFMAGYTNAPWTALDINPAEHAWATKGIGHMGYFRANAQPLWQAALNWFDSLGARSPLLNGNPQRPPIANTHPQN